MCVQAQDELSELATRLEKMWAEEKLLYESIPALQGRSDASGEHIVCLEAETSRLTVRKQELCAREAQTRVLCVQAQDEMSELATCLEIMRAEENLPSESIPALQGRSDASGEHIL